MRLSCIKKFQLTSIVTRPKDVPPCARSKNTRGFARFGTVQYDLLKIERILWLPSSLFQKFEEEKTDDTAGHVVFVRRR